MTSPAALKAAELKACPFCGGEAATGTVVYSDKTVREQQWDQAIFHQVNCMHCSAMVGRLVGYKTEAEAADAWNTRTPAIIETHFPHPAAGVGKCSDRLRQMVINVTDSGDYPTMMACADHLIAEIGTIERNGADKNARQLSEIRTAVWNAVSWNNPDRVGTCNKLMDMIAALTTLPSAGEVERLRAALREWAIPEPPNGASWVKCRMCGEMWDGRDEGEKHKPNCLAALSAQPASVGGGVPEGWQLSPTQIAQIQAAHEEAVNAMRMRTVAGMSTLEREYQLAVRLYNEAEARFAALMVVPDLPSPTAIEPQAGWRTMESAPRDGTEVLVWADGTMVAEWWAGFKERPADACWWSEGYGSCNATHWQPLPAGPAS